MIIPSTYTKSYRQIPEGALSLTESPSPNGCWVDLIALMPDERRLYITTKPAQPKNK